MPANRYIYIDFVSKNLSKSEKLAICEFWENQRGRTMCNINKLTMDKLDKYIEANQIDIRSIVHEMNRFIERQRAEEHRREMELQKHRIEREKQQRILKQTQENQTNKYIELWKKLTQQQREFIVKSVYDKNVKQTMEQFRKNVKLAETLIYDHNKYIDGDRFPQKLIDITMDATFTKDGFSIPKLRVEVCDVNAVSLLPSTFVEDTLKMEIPPASVLIPEMLYQLHKGNLITNHIRVSPNGKKFIPMKRITRRILK